MAFKNLALFFLLGLVSIHGLPVALENDAAPAAPVADVAEPAKDAEVPHPAVEIENVNQESKPESESTSDDQKFIFPIFSMGFPSMNSQPIPAPAPPPPAPPPQIPEIVFIPPNSQISVISQGTPIQIQQSAPTVVNVGGI